MKALARSNHLLSATFVCLVGLLIPFRHLRGQAANKTDPFDYRVQTFTLNHQTLFDAIGRLHEATGVVISVERVLSTTSASEADEEFTSTIPGGKPDVVLNEICALSGRYTWSREGKMVNIYPRDVARDQSYLFNRRIPAFSLQEVSDAPTAAIRAVRELPGNPAQLIILEAGNYDFRQPWTVEFKNLTLRQAINRIAEHLCSTCGWQLTGTRATPTVVFYRNLQESRGHSL